ncbi:hypothetical protein JHD50_03745 [Sulfurimonas sp. MAG313]|nr:hypothetical protein [Sulfurimonas sp. MAG313]MDF1880424.1 hypothetical protein [Sulfurimonas sp. MAG313]
MRNVFIALIVMMALGGSVYADDIIDDGHSISGIIVDNQDCTDFGDDGICSRTEVEVDSADDAALDE